MGTRRLVRSGRSRGGSGGAGLLVAGIAAIAGVGLIASANKKAAAREYERVGEDELPSVGDFERQLEALQASGHTPTGDPAQLEESDEGLRIDVIETTAEPAPVVS